MKNTTLPHLRYITTLSVLFIVSVAFPQDVLWEKSYGGEHAEYLFDVLPTMDYGFLLAGSSLSGRTGNKEDHNVGDLDYWLWKMDERGDLEWQKTYGGSGTDLLTAVARTPEGGYLLAGSSTSPNSFHKKHNGLGQEDVWLIRLDPKGGEVWQKTIGGPGRDVVNCVVRTHGGGYLIAGASSSPGFGSPDVAVGTGAQPPGGQEQTFDGNATPITKTSPHYGNMDYWVVKLDGTGEVEWERTYGGTYHDEVEAVAQTVDGGYIVGGYSNSPTNPKGHKSEDPIGDGGDYWILKLSPNGDIEWQQTLGGDKDDHLYHLSQTEDEGFILGGSSSSGTGLVKTKSNASTSSAQAGIDFWVLKLYSEGGIDWQETFDFGKTDVLTTITENEDGSFLIGGYAQSELTMRQRMKRGDTKGINDYVAVKIDSLGQERWRKHVGSSGTDVLKKVVETRDGGYVLAGTSNGKASRDKNSGKGREDFWVVKLRDEDKKEKERRLTLEAYPNPTLNYTNVVIHDDYENGTATVYDMLGKQLQRFKIQDRTVPVNLSGYPIGLYIIKIETNVKMESIKIIKGEEN